METIWAVYSAISWNGVAVGCVSGAVFAALMGRFYILHGYAKGREQLRATVLAQLLPLAIDLDRTRVGLMGEPDRGSATSNQDRLMRMIDGMNRDWHSIKLWIDVRRGYDRK